MITSSVPGEELDRLLHGLYWNLHCPVPEPSVVFWYEIGVEEGLRRAAELPGHTEPRCGGRSTDAMRTYARPG